MYSIRQACTRFVSSQYFDFGLSAEMLKSADLCLTRQGLINVFYVPQIYRIELIQANFYPFQNSMYGSAGFAVFLQRL